MFFLILWTVICTILVVFTLSTMIFLKGSPSMIFIKNLKDPPSFVSSPMYIFFLNALNWHCLLSLLRKMVVAAGVFGVNLKSI